MADQNFVYKCDKCDNREFVGGYNFRHHYRSMNHEMPIKCSSCENTYYNLTSLTRHVVQDHLNQPDVEMGEAPAHAPVLPVDIQEDVEERDIHEEDQGAQEPEVMEHEDVVGGNEENDDEVIDLKKTAATIILKLRQNAGVTSTAIESFQEACFFMAKQVCSLMKRKVKHFFNVNQIDTPGSQQLLEDMVVADPFLNMRTMKQQLNYFSKNFGLVKPVTKFLDYRTEYRLNPETSQHEPCEIPMTFEYIPVIDTLTQVLNKPKLKHLIETEQPSQDGCLRSYLDGTRAAENNLLKEHPRIIRLQLYWDDAEIVNPLGSKTTIHKLAAFYFSIQNLPPEENSQLSSVYLLALAHSEDIRVGGFDKVLAPFLSDVKRLESARGVKIKLNSGEYVLRATVPVLSADGLAALDLLGFLGPSARHFCRTCMISRQEFLADLNAVGEIRTLAMFEQQLAEVEQRYSRSKLYGVKRKCPLNKSKSFVNTEDSVYDIFHVFLEGIVMWVVALTLRSFITRKLVTVDDINGRIYAFDYGVTDLKNKPSANFTDKTLKTKKTLKQTGSQVWCLIRVFGFLFPDIPEDDPHLQLVNLLQQVMLICFSEKLRHEDIDKVENLIKEHNRLFQQLYMRELLEEDIEEEGGEGGIDDDDDDEEEDAVDEPEEVADLHPNARQAKKKSKRVTPGNKLHEALHLPGQMRKFGSLYRYWCARYEGRHHIFVRYGAVCGNFINPPKSMAQMHQMNTLASQLKTTLRSEDIETDSSEEVPCGNCAHSNLLFEKGIGRADIVSIVRTVTVCGEIYREGLFVLLDATTPTFGIIQSIYLRNQQVFFIVKPWQTDTFVYRFCGYKVKPHTHRPLIVEHTQLARHGAFAAWSPWNDKERVTYIAPRTIVF